MCVCVCVCVCVMCMYVSVCVSMLPLEGTAPIWCARNILLLLLKRM